MKTFSTLALAGSYAQAGPGEIIVGRLVANTEFIKALFRFGNFENFLFFVGEANDQQNLSKLFLESGWISPQRLLIKNLLDLPLSLQSGEVSFVHHNSSLDLFFHLVWLRDHYARQPLPITAQIHSLSYPRDMMHYLLSYFIPPSAHDAVFCSSNAGKEVVQQCLQTLGQQMTPYGLFLSPLNWELPVIPLGVDADYLASGNRREARQSLGIPDNGLVVLSLARFTEYDKMDLFPLLQAFKEVLQASNRSERPLFLLLAGGRQGTKTPETLTLWAKMLGIADRVCLVVDFAADDKPHLLAAADIFVSPCDNPQETFGLTVVEAMSAGLPVIASDFDGYKETITDEVGIKIPTRWGGDLQEIANLGPLLYERPLHLFLGQSIEVDLPALAAAITRLYQDDLLRERMGQCAKARAKKTYDWEVVIRQYEKVWLGLMEKPATENCNKKVPQQSMHPLTMNFQQIFAHYPTEFIATNRRVRRSDLSRLMCDVANYYPIYAELRNIISDEDVKKTLEQAEQAVRVDELVANIQKIISPRPAWHSSFLVAWLIKHGLLIDSEL